MSRKILALCLALVMLIGSVPLSAMASSNEREDTSLEENATIKGNNALGDMIAEKVNTQQTAQSACTPDYPYGYGVYGLAVSGNTATVEYHAVADAVMVVALYSEDGLKMLTSAKAPVSADKTKAEVTFAGTMPAYFMASAYLLNAEDYAPLCDAHSTPMYTEAMQKLMASTTDDYAPEQVWNLDEDKTNNFMVFQEETVVIRETGEPVVSTDSEKLTYRIENGDAALAALQPGDTVVYFYGQQDVIIAKVETASVDGATVTIAGGDIQMEDVFSHIKVDEASTSLGVDPNEKNTDVTYVGEAAEPARRTRNELPEEDADEQEIKKLEFEFGKADDEDEEDPDGELETELEVKGTIAIGAKCGFSYHMAEDQEYIQFRTDLEMDLDITVATAIKKTYTLFTMTSPPLLNGLLTIEFKPTYTIEFTAEFQTNNTFHVTFGFTLDDQEGCKPLNAPPFTVKNELTLEGAFKMYFTWNPSLQFAKGFIASLTLPVETGVAIVGKPNGTADVGMPSESQGLPSIHLCENCLRVTLGFVFNMKVEVKFLNCKFLTVSFDIFTEEDFANDLIAVECYYSADIDQFGWGICPNQKYLATIQVQRKNEIPVSDLNVWYRYSDDGKIYTIPNKTNRNGIITEYFVPGTYTFFTTIDEIQSETSVKITEACKVIIRQSDTGDVKATVLGSSDVGTVMDAGIVSEYGVCGKDGNNLTWALYDTGVLKIYGTGEMGSAPWKYSGISVIVVVIDEGVTSIVEEAFKSSYQLTKAILPESMEWIGAGAFASCIYLEEINIPSRVTHIGQGAFESCSVLKQINIPSRLTVIEDSVFYNCRGLESIALPEGLKEIGRSAFCGCSSLKKIQIPSQVTQIGSYAFAGCAAATEVNIPEGMTELPESIFSGCQALNHIVIPRGVKAIGATAFSECKSLLEIEIPAGVTVIGRSTFKSCESLTKVTLNGAVTTIGYEAFQNCAALVSFQLPATVTEIGEYAFAGCKSLQRLEIPKGVTVLKGYTVYGCEALSELLLPEGMTTLSDYALYYCTGLVSLRLPKSLTFIGAGAFAYCKNLQSIEIPTGISEIPRDAFSNCSSLTEVKLPDSVTEIGTEAFEACEKLVSIEIPAGVTSLGGWAFDNCAALETVMLHEGLTSIGQSAFQKCKSLQNITIPTTVTYIGRYAFSTCESLRTIEIPGSVESIGESTFIGNLSLTDVRLHEGVTTIGDSAFWGCSSLARIDIPSTVNRIDSKAFHTCSSLKSIVIPEGVTDLGYQTFYNCVSLAQIQLPSTLKTIGTDAFYNCDSLTYVDIPEGVTDIGSSFGYCDGLVSVTIPSTVTYIPGGILGGAFRYCTNLREVVLSDSVTEIGMKAFLGCENLAYVDLGEGLQIIGDSAFQWCKSLGGVVFPATLTHIRSSAFQDCEGLATLYFMGDAPQIDTWAFLVTFEGEFIKAYYPAGNATWTADKMPTYNGRITWVEGLPAAPARESADISAVTAVKSKPAPDTQQSNAAQLSDSGAREVRSAMIGGEYNTEEKDGYTLKTAAFENLIPGEAYVLLAVVDLEKETFLDPENLLYIRQAVAGEDGRLEFRYIQSVPTDVSYVMLCGKSNQDLKDATVTFQPMCRSEEVQAVDPSVVYGGKELKEGVDYRITGQVCYTEAGEYTCIIQGINQYTGTVECTYTVQNMLPGDMNADGIVTDSDAVYLLRHTLFPQSYPIYIPGDLNRDGNVTDADAVYLLRHTLFPGSYPIG